MEAKKEKIKLIRELENAIGYAPFPVDENSNIEDINTTLEFCNTSYSELENFLPKINALLHPE